MKHLVYSLVVIFSLSVRVMAQEYNTSEFRENYFSELNSKSWLDLLEKKPFQYRPPYTVNLLIQPVHSPSWIFVNPSMAVSRRYVSNGLTNDSQKTSEALHQNDMVMQFAFDNPAFMPDFNQVKLSLKDNRYPIAYADYFANDIYYQIEYVAVDMEDEQIALCVNIKAKNEGIVNKDANVRVKLGYYHEDEIFDYHYIPYYWDNTKWKPYYDVSLKDYNIYKGEKNIGQVVPGDMDVEWESSKSYTDNDYESILYPQVWYGSGYALPSYRLKQIQDVIHAYHTIKPKETLQFSVKLLVNEESATLDQISRLKDMSLDQIRSKAIEGYRKELENGTTQLHFPKNNWPNILSELQLSIKQLLIKYPGETFYQPSQGGSSERFYVWVFEAVHMLRSMLRVGQFDDVRHGLDFIFSLQDAGCPPVGKFTTTEGAIGTTGPRWANTTGMALVLACEYYLYSHDEIFLQTYLPSILKAVHWIEGEVKATRVLRSDGSRSLTYGLMPYAVGCDGETGFCVSDTDIYTFWGFNKTVELLEKIGHGDAGELRKQLDQYHHDLIYSINHLTEPNGFIQRIIFEEGVEQYIKQKFDITDSMTPISLVGIISPKDPIFMNFMRFFENNYSDGEFMGGMDREIMYINQCEHLWQQVYLKLGEWKKAFAVTQTCLNYGMSQDTYQTMERISKRNPSFAPWQPNGSANGRIIDMILNTFYYENSMDSVTLLGALPPEWIEETGRIELADLVTLNGKISMKVDKVESDTYLLTLDAENNLPSYIRIPNMWAVQLIDKSLKKKTDGWFYIKNNTKSIKLKLVKNKKC